MLVMTVKSRLKSLPSPMPLQAALVAVLLGGGVVVGGCDDKPAEPNRAPVAGGQVAGSNGGAPPVIGDTPPPVEVERAAFVRKARNLLDHWASRESGLVAEFEPRFIAQLKKLRWFKKLSTRMYSEGGYQLLFSKDGRLTESADILLEALYGVGLHGLPEGPYDLETLRGQVKAFSDASLAYQKAMATGESHQKLWNALGQWRQRAGEGRATLSGLVEDAGYTDEDVGRLDSIAKRLDAIFDTRSGLNRAVQDLEIALFTRYLRYIYDMRYAIRAHPFKADKTDGAGVERTAEDIFAWASTQTDYSAIGASLKALTPQIPDYAVIQKGLAKYRALAEAFPEHLELSSKVERLKPKGKKNDAELVKRLQQRLRQEEYFDGDATGVYDDALAESVRLYQETHQLKQSGKVDRKTRLSLNRGFKQRVDQLSLSLRRHRESELHQGEFPFGSTKTRGRINIPEFKATFYVDGKAARVHKVIVGNNLVEVNAGTGKKGWYNHTRMFTAEMRTIVLNPTWRVPARIKEQELDLKLIDEPDFYEKHNYEVKILANGTEQVMQLPGPNNALGLVKFLFPNPYAIYMHDTPNRRLFKRDVRAFSHGCMRTENPLELAEWILTELEGMEPKRFKKILDSREEYGIALKSKIPMTIDYNGVGIHSSGRMMFLSDPYRYDKDYFAGETPYPEDREHPYTKMVQ